MKILLIIDKWPSKTHPYFTYLFHQIKLLNNDFQLCINGKSDLDDAYHLIGEKSVKKVLENAIRYHFLSGNIRNPIFVLKCLKVIIFNFNQAKNIYNDLKLKGKTNIEAITKIIQTHELLGKKWDIVHINSLQTATFFNSNYIFNQAKLIVSSRGQDFDFYPTLYDDVLKNATHVHVLGNYLKNKVIERNCYHKDITIIPPAITNLYDVNHTKFEKTTFITTSRLYWTKGHVYILRALWLLKYKFQFDFMYKIIGDGPEKDNIIVEIDRLGLNSNVELLGWKVENESAQIIAQSHIYVMFSIEEAFNNSVLLAQSLGIPCVVSDAGGLPENVINEKTGIVVEKYNYEKLAEVLHNLALNSSKLKELGENAKTRSISEYNLPIQVTKYIEMYNKVHSN